MQESTAALDHHSRRADRAVIALIVVAGAFVTFVVRAGDPVIGSAQDDAIYMATAKAIADGRGYIHPELPTHPWQTKYPILYPLVLAAVWRAWPVFPDNVAAVQYLNGLFWVVGASFAYLALRRGFNLHWSIAGGGVLVALTCYAVPGVAQTAFSESLYFCLTAAAIWLATPAKSAAITAPADLPNAPLPGDRTFALLAGVAAAAAFLTRTIGVSLLVAVPLSFALRRRFAAAALSAVPCFSAFAGWKLWCTWAAARNAEIPMNAAFAYDLDYSAWLPPDLSSAAWVAANNVPEGLLSQFLFFIPPPFGWAVECIAGGVGTALPLYAGMLIVALLSIFGFISLARRDNSVIPIYIAGSVALVAVWPFSPGRFLVPLLPFSAVMLLHAIERLIQRAMTVVHGMFNAAEDEHETPDAGKSSQVRTVGPSPPRFPILLALLALTLNTRFLLTAPKGGRLAEAHQARLDTADLISKHVGPQQAVYCNFNAFMHLVTHRNVLPYLPNLGPIPHSYPSDRKPLNCGMLRPAGKPDYEKRIVQEEWPKHFKLTQAGFVVAPPEDSSYGSALKNLTHTSPALLKFVTETGPHRLYAIRGSE